jgi:hypothetical protein
MKPTLRFLALSAALCLASFAANAADHHDHKHLATPKGGRLLEKTEPHAELVVEKDRSVSINFYNHDLKPVAVTSQTATVIATPKTGKVTLEFEKKGDSLVSKSKLPEGDGYNLVIQFKQDAAAKPQNIRFKLDLSTCGGCKRAEYACTCGH